MKKHIIKIFSLCLIVQMTAISAFAQEDFRSKAPMPGPAPKIEMGKAYNSQLANGLKVIVVENHKLPRVSFQVFVDAPPLAEGEFAGASSMAGQLLSSGTTSRTKAQIDEEVDFIGASLSTSSSGAFASCLSKHKETLLEIMSDVLINPSFPEEEFDKIKKQTLSNLLQANDTPNSISSNVSQVLRYGKDHPYGEIETEASINNIELVHCQKFYVENFKPNISYFIAVGDITPKEAEALANKYFLKWSKGDVKGVEFDTPELPEETSVDFVDKTGAVQSVISVTYPIDLKPGTQDAIKANVLNNLLGGSGTLPRLNANLREDKGYTYGAYSTMRADRYAGHFSAGASVRNEVTDSALVQILMELNKLRDELIPDEELTRVKNVLTGSFARQLESPQTVARFALNTARYDLPDDYYSTYLEKVNAVTKEDLQEIAKRYINPANAHIVIVGSKDDVAEKLTVFSANNKINYYDKSGEPISDTGATIPEGVTASTIIADYLQAIGGKDALMKVNSMKVVSEASVQGMTIETAVSQKAPNKTLLEVTMGGNVMQKIVFNGEKGAIVAMGQNQPFPPAMNDKWKISGNAFPELAYEANNVSMELKGIETIDGKNTYKVSIKYPSGDTVTDYFDQESSLKVRTIASEAGQTQTTDFADYKEVNGVQIPHTVTVSGAMPFPLKTVIKTIEMNVEMDDAIFNIE